jgi:hypothetical protein
MNYAPDLQALFLYLNSPKQTKSSIYMSRLSSLDSVLAQDLFDSFLWNCDFSPFFFSACVKCFIQGNYCPYILAILCYMC